MAKRNKSRKARRAKKKEALLAQPDVAVTVAVATPEKEKKYGGGSMMVPPEREGYVGGAVVKAGQQISKLIKKYITPLSAGQEQSKAATRSQAVSARDRAWRNTAIVVAGPVGYYLKSREGTALLNAADAGEIDVDVINPDERINPEDFPTYEKDTDSANAFQDAFRQAREARADTFEFEGRTYLADLPVDREQKQEGGAMLVPPEMENTEALVDTYPNIPPEEMAEVKA